ncbi:2-succinyl-6-hydroxy-2,4-cyclohexadiene-1-carboxylate synthase [Spirulina sp. CS-785/01]|uniref:2-succinyl-6-hydroxy-2, 4-cyclohexadiene-1-carboxylate synthase n=1 Tax=Spirulina sp. CS-785/01 TaxID=3021716 RepID=UPI00232CB444|nr:2-succinyl-6-hydroxy-2,4-cyclohexadiene-1-carboxylate synthase [Spirulina sp. CS-785/01]MDB9314871.1 2-succinyl-6-hydroxy-2,4-cyclohexadiene-1-carboxylate synthase [Spirulina sp. CS-785/01]
MLLHGFMGSGEDFRDVIALLQPEFNCLTYDLLGHGENLELSRNEAYTMPQTAQSIIDWLDTQNITQSYLVGYSMGGRIALYLALQFPQYFPKIILESASPGLETATEREQRRNRDEQLAQQLETLPFSEFLTRWYNNPLFASLKPHPQFPTMYQRRLNNSPPHLATSLRYCGTGVQPSLWEKLPQLSSPLLLLVGDKDQKFLRINQKISQTCPTSQLQVIENCGHNIHLETPHRFSYTVKQFLHGL